MTQTTDFLAHLDDLAVLRIEGEDAIDFLHAQLSNDISALGADEARLAAYCNPKGRMLGSLVLWRETAEPGSALLALVKADVLDSLLKRLRMFVLRSKVSFETTSLNVHGASAVSRGTAGQADALAQTPGSSSPVSQGEADLPACEAPWQVRRNGELTLISAPVAAGGPVRWWLIASADADADTLAGQFGLARGEASAWQAQDIEAGLGWVENANLELFIPQSLNYDLNGGVSFTKGCYPGQEVVARAHFRGAVKRRGLPGQCHLPDDFILQAGMDVFDAKRPKSPAGRIINAAAGTPEAGQPRAWHVFMEINLNDIDEADFRAISAEGPAIRLLPLPYSLAPRPSE